MIYLNKEPITMNELKEIVNTSDKVIELVDLDGDNNLYFELKTYGIYY